MCSINIGWNTPFIVKTMRITFSIEYHTYWGEELFLMLGNDLYSAVKMNYTAGGIWVTALEVSDVTHEMRYRYLVKEGGVIKRVEQCKGHSLSLPSIKSDFYICDYWNDETSSPIENDLMRRLLSDTENTTPVSQAKTSNVIIEATVPIGSRKARPAIAGDALVLGRWNVKHAITMSTNDGMKWRAAVDIPVDEFPVQFKLITIGNRGEVEWESGANRCLHHAPNSHELMIVNDLCFRNHNSVRNGVDVVIDLLTLRSDKDMGAGDLGDVKKLIQWASTTGHDGVSLSSLADDNVVTGWMPDVIKNAVQENAIDPIYLCPSSLGTLNNKAIKAKYQKLGIALNHSVGIPILEVRTLKTDYARAIFSQKSTSLLRLKAYRDFVSRNVMWLHPYVAQYILQHINGSTDPATWGSYVRYNPENIEKFLKAHHREASFLYFVQFHLRRQLVELAHMAREKKLSLNPTSTLKSFFSVFCGCFR